MPIVFEWSQNKARSNLRKHGVDFAEAKTVFGDEREMMIDDPDHSEEEERFISIGKSSKERVLLVSYTEEGDRVRLISARPATNAERKRYEENR